MQKYLATTQHTVAWFKKIADAGDLIIKPPFQRNPVWSERQKSSLIDTILLEYPIPELYMQELTEPNGDQKHIVVDGQQRIRAVLGFIAGEYEINDESPSWPGLGFEELTIAERKRVFEYNFVVRVLPEMPDEELRAIFQRINRNNVTLNAQELRHATYWGPFIALMEELSNLDFWASAGIFSANDTRRMLDVEFISEICIAFLNGLQNKKKNLEEYYQQYEIEFEESDRVRTVFQKVLGELEQVLPEFQRTRWRKKSDFYTLFLCLAHHSSQLPLSSDKRSELAKILKEFASAVDLLIASGEVSDHDILVYTKNVDRAASDLGSRRSRQDVLSRKISPVFSQACTV